MMDLIQIAAVDVSVDVGVIMGTIAGILAAIYGFTKFVLNQSVTDRDNDRKERIALMGAIDKMAHAMEKVAIATEKSANEAKERNGHLGEQNVQIVKLVTRQNKDIAQINATISKNMGKAKTQHVKEQVVEHQVVEHQDK